MNYNYKIHEVRKMFHKESWLIPKTKFSWEAFILIVDEVLLHESHVIFKNSFVRLFISGAIPEPSDTL